MHTQALPWNQGGTAKDRVRFGNVSHGKGHGHLAVSFHFSIRAAFRWMINVYCKQCSYNRENEKKNRVIHTTLLQPRFRKHQVKEKRRPKSDPSICVNIRKRFKASSWKPCSLVGPKLWPWLCKYLQKRYLWEGRKPEVLNAFIALCARMSGMGLLPLYRSQTGNTCCSFFFVLLSFLFFLLSLFPFFPYPTVCRF